MSANKTATTALPPTASKRLMPFIERGIANGIFKDASPVVDMFNRKSHDASLKETIDSLGGLASEVAQAFLTDIVLTDLTSILRQKRYAAHVQVWSVSHSTIGAASGNPRPVCNIFGQAVMMDGDDEMDAALFSMSLWDEDASVGDDVEVDGIYEVSVSCRNLDAPSLDLKALTGLTSFVEEEYAHADSVQLLKDTYDVVDIADLEDDLSKGRNDYRLIEATVSYSGVQNSRAGNQFGKILLKDESTMTLEAIESGESLMLNALCSPDIALKFGKYSKILALITTKVQGEYGLSANIAVAVPVILVAPIQAVAVVKTEKEDDAADYFKKASAQAISLDDDDDDDDEVVEEKVVEAPPAVEVVEAPPAPAEPVAAPEEALDDEDDDDEELDLTLLPVKALKAMAKGAGVEGFSTMKKAELIVALSDEDEDPDDAPPADAAAESDGFVDGEDEDEEWEKWD